jgi:hypothetical protein
LAAGAQTYVTTFAVAGKLLASFKTTMAQTNAQLRALAMRARQTTTAVTTGFAQMGKAVSGLKTSLAALGTMFAGFIAANLFSKIFHGATEAAMDADEATRRLAISFMRVQQMKERGEVFSKEVVKHLNEQNERLEQQGVLSSEVYAQINASLAALGFSPRRILDSNELLGDMLVRWKGIRANEEDATEQMRILQKVIQAPKPRMQAFMQMFPEVGPDEIDRIKNAKNREERLKVILDIGKAYAGLNRKVVKEPGGEWKRFTNLIRKVARDIGHEILPAQDKMAKAWEDLLPKIKPVLELIPKAFNFFIDNADVITKSIRDITIAMLALKAATLATRANLAGLTLGLLIISIEKASSEYEKFQDLIAKKPVSDPEHFTKHWYLLNQSWTEAYAGFKAIWWDLPLKWHDQMMKFFKDFDWTFGFKKQWDDAIKAWFTWWDSVKQHVMHPFGGGAAGGGAGGAAAVAAATAPAQAAAAQIPLSAAGLQAVQKERAEVMADMARPELRNLISATLATEAAGAEDQKNVLESLTNRLVAQKRAGNYGGVEAAITGGFYGPYNRGQTSAVMAKGLSDARYQQVGQMLNEVAAGRNALGGLTDQGMVNEIKGAIKEQHGEDYYGLQGLPGETESAAYKYSRQFQHGGIVGGPTMGLLGEAGAEAVIPLRGGSRARGLLDLASRMLGGPPVGGGTHVSFAPSITIHGGADAGTARILDSNLRNLARDFIQNFKAAQAQERRLSYESGYG